MLEERTEGRRCSLWERRFVVVLGMNLVEVGGTPVGTRNPCCN